MRSVPQSFAEYIAQDTPLISVVIPAFNKVAFLPETIASVASQQYPAIEVIVADDESTDNTAAAIEQLSKYFLRLNIKYFLKKNGGVSDTRNFATERARGRLILNLDADDLIKPGFIHEALRLMRAENANVVTSNVELFGAETGEWCPTQYGDYMNRYTNTIPTLVLYDRDIWVKAGGYSRAFAFNEDWNFFVTAQRFTELRVAKTSAIFFRYRMMAGGLAAQFIKDSGDLSIALVNTANSALYPIEEVFWAHELLAGMPERWFHRFKEQHQRYPQEWILKFWLGLVEQRRGNLQQAAEYFDGAIQVSCWKEWQPMYAMARIIDPVANPDHVIELLGSIRTLRPDMKRLVSPQCDQLLAEKLTRMQALLDSNK